MAKKACLTNNLKINSPVPFRTSAFLRLRFQLLLPNGLLKKEKAWTAVASLGNVMKPLNVPLTCLN